VKRLREACGGNAIADVVLAYRPKPKSKAAKKSKKLAKRASLSSKTNASINTTQKTPH